MGWRVLWGGGGAGDEWGLWGRGWRVLCVFGGGGV